MRVVASWLLHDGKGYVSLLGCRRMPQQSSFDVTTGVDLQEVDNAINQAQKEMAQRYDFKGSKSKIEWDKKKEITLVGDDEYKLKAVTDILQSKLIKRGISIRNLTYGKAEAAFEGTMRQK